MKLLERLIHLKSIQDTLKKDLLKESCGICFLVEASYDDSKLMKRLWSRWPEFSGCADYPVRHPALSPIQAFETRSLWAGEYGAARRRLLDYLITCLQKEEIEWVEVQFDELDSQKFDNAV